MTLKAIVPRRSSGGGGPPTDLTGDTTLTPGDSGKSYTNTGAPGLVTITAPAITVGGIEYEFIITQSTGILFQADPVDRIQDASQITAGGGGNISGFQVGGTLKIKSVFTTDFGFVWYVMFERKSWLLQG